MLLFVTGATEPPRRAAASARRFALRQSDVVAVERSLASHFNTPSA